MGSMQLKVEGLTEALRAIKDIDRSIANEIKAGFREDIRPLFNAYRAYASALGGSGAYASSTSMKSIAKGVRIQSSDPAAGVIEFANRGAVYLSGPRAGRRIGVPHVGKPRALMRAVDEHEPQIVRSAEARVAQVIERYLGNG